MRLFSWYMYLIDEYMQCVHHTSSFVEQNAMIHYAERFRKTEKHTDDVLCTIKSFGYSNNQ